MQTKLNEIYKKIENEKNKQQPLVLNFKTSDSLEARLELITKSVLEDAPSIELLSKWRRENSHAFPAQFNITDSGTKKWCEMALINCPDRLLFWVIDNSNQKIGHVGLFRLSEDASQIEIDNIVRGEISKNKELFYFALLMLLEWQREFLNIQESYLRVFSDNLKALNIYGRLGYKEIQRVPLERIVGLDRVDWKEIVNSPYKPAEKYFITMKQTLC